MKCRHCASADLLPCVDLGSAPPSNAYLSAGDLSGPETWYPLRVLACRRCWLVQTEDFTGREALFRDDYAYFSSYSTSWLDHCRAFVDQACERFALGPRSLVVEVAANDGYLLQYVAARGVPCIGVEPTAGTAAAARARGLEVVESFFGSALGAELAATRGTADLTVANNVLAHVPDIDDFVTGFARLLAPGGVAVFEFPQLAELVRLNQFDTIYHEHFSYLSLTAVGAVFAACGLGVFDVEPLPTHGGSLRVYAQRADTGRRPVTPAVAAQLALESGLGMDTPGFYAGLQARADRLKNEFLAFLLAQKQAGRRVAAYGAAAKGNTLLNFAGVRPDLLPFVVDRNPAKQGRFLPGSRIPVVDESALRAARPEVVLILPWNLREEITAQLAWVREWGGRFAWAVPVMTVEPA